MKKLLLLLFVVATITSCNNDDDSTTAPVTLEGTWQLSAIYLDPGDGSGNFQPTVSERTLTFQSNGIVSANFSICNEVSQGNSSTTYSANTGEIDRSDCTNDPSTIRFEIVDSELILSYQCIEACQHKYLKI